ncbi:hypothetical protein ABH941_005078 [Streptacidiphilus sp. EB103A]
MKAMLPTGDISNAVEFGEAPDPRSTATKRSPS